MRWLHPRAHSDTPVLVRTIAVRFVLEDVIFDGEVEATGDLDQPIVSAERVVTRQTGSSGGWEYEEFLRRAAGFVGQHQQELRAAARPEQDSRQAQLRKERARQRLLRELERAEPRATAAREVSS